MATVTTYSFFKLPINAESSFMPPFGIYTPSINERWDIANRVKIAPLLYHSKWIEPLLFEMLLESRKMGRANNRYD
jgi:hypothetical protein